MQAKIIYASIICTIIFTVVTYLFNPQDALFSMSTSYIIGSCIGTFIVFVPIMWVTSKVWHIVKGYMLLGAKQ